MEDDLEYIDKSMDIAPADESQRLYFTPAQIASLYGISESWLEKARIVGGGPPFIKVNKRSILYKKSDLYTWFDSLTVMNTSHG